MWRYRRILPPRDTISTSKRNYMCPLKWLQHNTSNIKDGKCAKFKFQRYIRRLEDGDVYGRKRCKGGPHFFNCVLYNDKERCWNIYKTWRDRYVEV